MNPTRTASQFYDVEAIVARDIATLNEAVAGEMRQLDGLLDRCSSPVDIPNGYPRRAVHATLVHAVNEVKEATRTPEQVEITASISDPYDTHEHAGRQLDSRVLRVSYDGLGMGEQTEATGVFLVWQGRASDALSDENLGVGVMTYDDQSVLVVMERNERGVGNFRRANTDEQEAVAQEFHDAVERLADRVSVTDLGVELPEGPRKALEQAGKLGVGVLRCTREAELVAIDGVGQVSVERIVAGLTKLGLGLAPEEAAA